MHESNIDTSTSERQLLYDIRTEQRKTNELLSSLISTLAEKQDATNDLLLKILEVLHAIAKRTEQKVSKQVKPKVAPRENKPKRGITDEIK